MKSGDSTSQRSGIVGGSDICRCRGGRDRGRHGLADQTGHHDQALAGAEAGLARRQGDAGVGLRLEDLNPFRLEDLGLAARGPHPRRLDPDSTRRLHLPPQQDIQRCRKYPDRDTFRSDAGRML